VGLPSIIYNEEVMREGFGIEAVAIPLERKLELLDKLAGTGLRRIVLGAFVSPRYVPQMADFKALLELIRPRAGISYLTFVHSRRARETAAQHSPPLTLEDETCQIAVDICDIHQRRNVNASIEDVMAGWSATAEDAASRGVRRGQVAIYSAWGSNFQGKFSQDYRMSMLAREIEVLERAGIEVAEIGLHDSQSWSLPHEVEEDLVEIRRRWPAVQRFHLHMHDARGMALPGIWAALRTLDADDTLVLDGTLGGIGGGQYCGNGRASAMAATEDVMHMLEGMGIQTGVDLGKLIECVWLLEEIIGRPAFGHVSKAGPRPEPNRLYDANLPAIESLDAAKHFHFGPSAYAGEGYSPWRAPIEGPYFRGVES
jgi:hydroxymethylglutaryl-CoA lyase